MSRFVPISIAVLAIVALTVVEGLMSERWGDNRHGAYCATLMEEVPMELGSWVATDNEVTDIEREGSGARGYVSRSYRNAKTGQQVGVWFIVGHARDTFRHTPDVCYGGSGFKLQDGQERYVLSRDDSADASFFTGLFTRPAQFGGEELQRVFWSWFRPNADSGEPVVWRVPEKAGSASIRYEFAAAPALFKLYFTTGGDAAKESGDSSDCMDFAQLFLDTLDPVLARANGPIPDDFDASTVDEV